MTCKLYLNFLKTQKEEAIDKTLSKGIYWTMAHLEVGRVGSQSAQVQI